MVLALKVLPTSVAHLSVEVEAAAQYELTINHRPHAFATALMSASADARLELGTAAQFKGVARTLDRSGTYERAAAG